MESPKQMIDTAFQLAAQAGNQERVGQGRAAFNSLRDSIGLFLRVLPTVSDNRSASLIRRECMRLITRAETLKAQLRGNVHNEWGVGGHYPPPQAPFNGAYNGNGVEGVPPAGSSPHMLDGEDSDGAGDGSGSGDTDGNPTATARWDIEVPPADGPNNIGLHTDGVADGSRWSLPSAPTHSVGGHSGNDTDDAGGSPPDGGDGSNNGGGGGGGNGNDDTGGGPGVGVLRLSWPRGAQGDRSASFTETDVAVALPDAPCASPNARLHIDVEPQPRTMVAMMPAGASPSVDTRHAVRPAPQLGSGRSVETGSVDADGDETMQ